jgi:hypothetical protein
MLETYMILPKTRLFLAIVALGAGATALTAMPASAQVLWRNAQPVTVNFTYDPDASAATNYRNLLVKVKRACPLGGPLALSNPASQRACIEQMTDRSVAELNRPDLLAAHEAAKGEARRQLAVR